MLAKQPFVVHASTENGLIFSGAILQLRLPRTNAGLRTELVLVHVYKASAIANRLRELGVEATEAILAPVQPTKQEVFVAHVALPLPARVVGLGGRYLVFRRIDRRRREQVGPLARLVANLESRIQCGILCITRCSQVSELGLACPGTHGLILCHK